MHRECLASGSGPASGSHAVQLYTQAFSLSTSSILRLQLFHTSTIFKPYLDAFYLHSPSCSLAIQSSITEGCIDMLYIHLYGYQKKWACRYQNLWVTTGCVTYSDCEREMGVLQSTFHYFSLCRINKLASGFFFKLIFICSRLSILYSKVFW